MRQGTGSVSANAACIDGLERRTFLAADGVLDPTFGDGGEAVYLGVRTDHVIDLPGGGYARATGAAGMEVLVVTPDGKPDPAFAGDGTAAGAADEPGAKVLALQPDGKIIAAGVRYSDELPFSVGVLVRYNVDGTRDASFDSDGKVEAPNLVGAADVAVADDGRIVVATASGVAQFSAAGVPESDVRPGKQLHHETVRAVAAPDGTVVVAGCDLDDFFLYRVDAAGQVGSTREADVVSPRKTGRPVWTGQRHERVLSDPWAYLTDIAIQPDGKILATGDVWDGVGREARHAVVVRLNPDFSLDETFGKRGVFALPARSYRSFPRDVDVLADGGIVFTAKVVPHREALPAYEVVLRLTPAGRPDRGFGRAGISRALGAHAGHVRDVTVQPDGKYVVHGERDVDGPPHAARYVLDESRRK